MKLHHAAIEVSNMDVSIPFYLSLGFVTEEKFSFLEERIAFLTLEDFRLEIIEPGLPSKQSQQTHLAFEVESISELLKEKSELVDRVIEGPYRVNQKWKTIFIEGPDEEVIEFLEVL